MKLHRVVCIVVLVLAVPRLASAQASPRYRDPNMRIAGIVLTALACGAAVAGSSLLIAAARDSSDDALPGVAAYVGIPLLAGTAVFAGIGIPLWVVGGQPAGGQALAPAIPAVAAGPKGVTLQWRF